MNLPAIFMQQGSVSLATDPLWNVQTGADVLAAFTYV